MSAVCCIGLPRREEDAGKASFVMQQEKKNKNTDGRDIQDGHKDINKNPCRPLVLRSLHRLDF